MGGFNFPTIDSAIAQFEGANTPGTVAARNNNPGNLIYGPFAQSQGATGADSAGFGIFQSLSQGAAALDARVTQLANAGQTLDQIIATWSPASAPGNSQASTSNYQKFAASKTGLDPNVPVISQIGPSGPTGATGSTSNGLPSLGDILKAVPPLVGFGTNPVGTANGETNIIKSLSGFSWARVGSFMVGAIAIAGGIYLIKPVQEVFDKTAGAVASAAV